MVPVCFALNPCLYDSTTLTLFIYSQISPGSPHLSFSLKYIIFFFNYNKIRDSPVSSEGQNVPTGPNTKKEKKNLFMFLGFLGNHIAPRGSISGAITGNENCSLTCKGFAAHNATKGTSFYVCLRYSKPRYFTDYLSNFL